MAGRKYSRILAASRYYAAIDNYIAYITDATKRGGNVGNGTARPESQRMYIIPFGVDLPASTYAVTSGNKASRTTYATHVSTINYTSLNNTQRGIKISGYRAARLIIASGRSTTGVVKTSKVTGMKYLSYGGKTTSIPFGKDTAELTKEQDAVFTDAAAAIQAANAGLIVTLQPEKV